MSYVLAAAGIAVLIVLHELGHFVAAKAVGMRVERFALFFPPILGAFRRGETEYAVGLIPLGGYVKISGMSPLDALPKDVEHRGYYRQPAWKRIVVIAAGPLVNIVLAFALLWVFFMAQGPGTEVPRPTVDTITTQSAAVGVLRPGDRIVAVDGVRGDTDRLRTQITSHRCAGAQTDGCKAAKPAKLTLVRDGRTLTQSVYPRYSASMKRALVGFSFNVDLVYNDKQHPVKAAGSSVSTMWRVTHLTVSAIGRLFYSSQARKQVSGIVGTYETTRSTIKTSSFETSMSLLALISLSLGIINLFPFLPLDGGHIFWALAEKVRGRAIAFSVMERASVVGFVLVAFLFIVGLSNDIGRLGGAGFGVR